MEEFDYAKLKDRTWDKGRCRLMNKKIGVYSSIVNLISVICFALSMLFSFNYGSYFSSMFIAFSFVPMMCGLLFNYDLPGYAVMSLAVFLPYQYFILFAFF